MDKQIVVIDFETYYDKDFGIRQLGYVAYTQHPKFDAYMVSIYGEGIEYVGHPSEAPWDLIDGKVWVAHNAAFDRIVYNSLGYTQKPKRWLDSAAMCAYCKLPRSLAGAISAAFPDQVADKTMRDNAMGKTAEDLKFAGLWDDMLKYCMDDSKLTYQLVEKYLDQWPEHERELSEWTMKQTMYGYRVDLDEINEALKSLKETRQRCKDAIPWTSVAYMNGLKKQYHGKKIPKSKLPCVLSTKLLKEYCEVHKIPNPESLAITSDKYMKWVTKYGKHHPVVQAMSEYRSVNAIEKKVKLLKTRAIDHGDEYRFQAGLMYFKAHTGRWAGGSGFNEQNLPRDLIHGVDLRKMLKPKKGHKFVIVDLSQIEPRCLAWLSKDKAFLEYLESGISPYEAHARVSMGWTGGKLKEEDPKMYSLAKARVLALGYQCGAGKFIEMAKAFAGLDISLETSKEIVKDFRDNNPKIVAVWETLQKRLQKSVGLDFSIRLPSGRTLDYMNVESTLGSKFGRTSKEYQAQIVHSGPKYSYYGGKLTENLVQAMARDVFASGLLRLFRQGYTVVLTAHDEFIVEVPEDQAEEQLQVVTRIVTQTPPWAPGLPVAAEGGIFDYYTK